MGLREYLSHNWLARKINTAAIDLLVPSLRGRVVDLGAGEAPYRELLLGHATTYVAVDWPKSYHGKSRLDVFADLSRALPLANGCADVVTAFQVLEHLPDPFLAVAECHRLLVPGGTVFIAVPFLWHLHEEPYDFMRFTRYGLESILRRSGFVNVRVRANSGYWTTAFFEFNYHTQRWGQRGGRLVRLALAPIWFVLQVLGPILDRLDPNPTVACGYFALADKPAEPTSRTGAADATRRTNA